MTAALLCVAVLLLAGVALRLRFAVFRWLYIPASVIGGILGLAIVQSITGHARGTSGPTAASQAAGEITAVLADWPSWLIAVVFAGMLLERKPGSVSQTAPRVARQGLMVWVIVLGQTAVGLLVTWLLVQPFFDAPNSIGMLIETGFAGGHGTAAAMQSVFEHEEIGLETGGDLGIMMATCGLVLGVITGVVWINVAVRRGWVRVADEVASRARVDGGGVDAQARRPIGHARVGGETVDPLLLQAIWLALAFGVGLALQHAVAWTATLIDAWWLPAAADSGAEQQLRERLTLGSIFGSFPLFIYTLFGGLIVRRGLAALGAANAIDPETVNRLTSAAMDVLVVAAITALDLRAVVNLIVPFSMLLIAGAIWSSLCLLVLARWILPRPYWFQLGIINYGMSTGVTATGFVLLKMIDPELESGAAEDYALAAPLSSPFVGGGMLTIGLPLIVLERVPIWSSFLVLALLVTALVVVGKRWNEAEAESAGDA